MLWQMASFHSFHGWVVLHCTYMPHLLYPFTCQWTSRLFPCLGYCKMSAVMNIGVHVSFWMKFFSGYMPRSGIVGLYGNTIFSLIRNLLFFVIFYFAFYILVTCNISILVSYVYIYTDFIYMHISSFFFIKLYFHHLMLLHTLKIKCLHIISKSL